MFDFLTIERIAEIHERSLREHGGADGVRDMGLIESALGSAQNAYYYGNGDAFDVAAAYAFHLAESQAFLDGNKRTGIGSALYFLARHGYQIDHSQDGVLYDAVIRLATRDLDKAGLAQLMRSIAEPIP